MRRAPHIMYRAVTPSTPLIWSDQATGYRSAVPGRAGYGFDSVGGFGQHATNPTPNTTTLFFVDDNGPGSTVSAHPTEPRTYYGTAEGAQSLKASMDQLAPMVVLFIKPGYINLKTDLRFRNYATVAGHMNPAITVLRHTQISTVISFGVSTAVNCQFWHLDIRMDDDAAGIATGNRDCAYAGSGTTGGELVQNIWINCGFGHSLDELVDAYTGVDLLAFDGCLFYEPLHRSIHDDTGTPDEHGYGPVMGPAKRCDRVSIQHCKFAHIESRQPYIAALRFAYLNNLIYNPGSSSGASTPSGVILSRDYDASPSDPGPFRANMIGNMFVAGPNSPASINAVHMPGTEAQPAGSIGFLGENCAHGFTYGSDAALMAGTFPGGWLQGSRIAAAWPAGWETYSSIGAGTNPNGFTLAEKIAFADKFRQTVGPKPSYTDSVNRARIVAAHCYNRLVGTGDPGQVKNSISGTDDPSGFPNAALRFAPNVYGTGGFPTISGTALNPYSPSPFIYGPCPLVADGRDVPYTSGSFSNGKSRIGYTPLQEWIIEHHWDVTPQ